MSDKIRICFIIPEIQSGGAEKVLTIILKNLSPKKFDTELLTLKKPDLENISLPENVNVKTLNLCRTRFALLKIIPFIRKTNAQIIFVFNVNNINLLIPAIRILRRNIKIVIREPTILSLHIKNHKFPLSWILLKLHKISMAGANKIVALSQDMKNDIQENFKINSNKIVIINNPIDFDELNRKCLLFNVMNLNRHNVSAIGRLVPEKGFDKIIKALAMTERKDIKLFIVGGISPENPKYFDYLINLVGQLNLENQVEFTGYQSNPYPYILNSSFLAMASTFEGLPNVALEANALGVPVLSFKCPGGIKDIIIEGLNGWLIDEDDISEFSKAIIKTISHNFDKSLIIEKAKECYSIEKVLWSYENLLVSL